MADCDPPLQNGGKPHVLRVVSVTFFAQTLFCSRKYLNLMKPLLTVFRFFIDGHRRPDNLNTLPR
jgi:hypothetical protein